VNQLQAIDSKKQLDNGADRYDSSVMNDIAIAIAAIGMLIAITVGSITGGLFKAAVDAPFHAAQEQARAD
jgi:hypothetical protein